MLKSSKSNKNQSTYVKKQIREGKKQFSKFVPKELYSILQDVTNKSDKINELILVLKEFEERESRQKNEKIEQQEKQTIIKKVKIPSSLNFLTNELSLEERRYLDAAIKELSNKNLSERQQVIFLFKEYNIYTLGRGKNKDISVDISRPNLKVLQCLSNRSQITNPTADFISIIRECKENIKKRKSN